MDIIAIGDTTVDEFIRLKEAHVSCEIDEENCVISMAWGDKIPFDFSVLVPGVGNAANAAVAGARLGLSVGFISNVGKDRYGEEILETFKRENVDTHYITINEGLPTNHHYVLWYGSERTILIRHEAYSYALPKDLQAPKWIYLSSIRDGAEIFHDELVTWLIDHPETKLAFQPGTFQINLGKDRLMKLYGATQFAACNKAEAERILELGETDPKILLEKMHALGPKTVLVTNGRKGAYAYDGQEMFKIPMYPDPRLPYERTGAGDACTAAITAALTLDVPFKDALLWGPINSMSVVQEIGAQKGLLTRDAIEKYLTSAPSEYRIEPL